MLKSILMGILSMIVPIIVVFVGVFIVGFGIYMEWEWMITAGIFVGAIGVLWTLRMWWED